MAHVHWPLFDLRVRTPRLELRYPDDAMLVELADLAAAGVHDPDRMPFSVPWTDVAPPLQQRYSLQHHWLMRAQWTAKDWHLPMVTVHDGEVVGSQAMLGKDFAVLRAVSTGSWLGLAHQGRGFGKEMRAAILHLAFAGLGAEVALSGAWHDNAASLGVSRSFGYEENGRMAVLRRDQRDHQVLLRLPREVWEKQRRDDIEIVGLDACLDLFGLAESGA